MRSPGYWSRTLNRVISQGSLKHVFISFPRYLIWINLPSHVPQVQILTPLSPVSYNMGIFSHQGLTKSLPYFHNMEMKHLLDFTTMLLPQLQPPRFYLNELTLFKSLQGWEYLEQRLLKYLKVLLSTGTHIQVCWNHLPISLNKSCCFVQLLWPAEQQPLAVNQKPVRNLLLLDLICFWVWSVPTPSGAQTSNCYPSRWFMMVMCNV